ncbi:competence protein ComEA [Arthrobacter sp. TS-15]|uniref:helix-hairpin-helix domain-containing protein n=1 Tax=Arthrobacter sp. TS-15 TaxID=2510797 RepID=UPI00115D2647|nr:helix-hairpin-helix domain-containing protein [Arthrobacter sp. TS-15]TQS91777.1 competence protein ComEA [Arthrobacter sp. TS-15]
MPRRNRDASPDAAMQAARQRYASRLGTDTQTLPLLQLPQGSGQAFDDSNPESRVHHARTRWRTPWPVAVLLAIVGVGFIAWHLWQSAVGQSSSEPLSPTFSSGPAVPESSESPQAAASGSVVVHVAGAVHKPGIVSLPQGSRVFQAIEAAGGAVPNAELNGLNLAEELSDGVKVHVPLIGEMQSAPSPLAGGSLSPGGTAAPSAKGAKVNINTASLEELGTLPRVGPVTAQGIIDWRKEHGPFASVDELDAVDGIGPKLMESLKELVTVQGG